MEPYLKRLTPCTFWQSIVYEAGKCFFKSLLRFAISFRILLTHRQAAKAILGKIFSIVCTCSLTSNSSSIRACRSTQRQRNTPSFTGSGQPPPTPQIAPVAWATTVVLLPCHSDPITPQCLLRSSDAPNPEVFVDPYHCCGQPFHDPPYIAQALWRVVAVKPAHRWFALPHGANLSQTYLCV